MQAIILAGGLGTRLRPLTLTKPKCLLPILNKAMIEYVFESFPKSVEEVFLTLSYTYDFPEKLLAEKFPDVDIKIFKEEEPLGTGGPIKALRQFIKGDFIALNGDILSSIDLDGLIKFHKKKKGLGAISLYSVDNPRPYGVVELDKNGRLKRFEEKPEEPFSSLINAGTYVFSPKIFDHFPDSEQLSLEREVLAHVAKNMYGYEFKGHWLDCGTFETFLKANALMLAKNGSYLGTKLEGTDLREEVHIGESRIQGGVIGPDVVIGDGCVIANTTLVNTVIFGRTRIDPFCKIENSIIGENCKIGKNCYIEGCVLGDGTEVASDKRLKDQKLPRMA
jgi:NDP-sugar pyrophosphorylase family protein